MANMNIQNYGSDKEIVLGDGFYESGKVTIAANGEVVQGDLLARDRGGSGKFIPYTGIAVSGLIDPICAIYTGKDKLEGGAGGADVPLISLVLLMDLRLRLLVLLLQLCRKIWLRLPESFL